MYKLMKPVEARCLQCGATIHGRPDKKFCDSVCRNAYHNRVAASQRRYRDFVLEAIEVNYAILKEALIHGRQSIPQDEAVAAGFNPDITYRISASVSPRSTMIFNFTGGIIQVSKSPLYTKCCTLLPRAE